MATMPVQKPGKSVQEVGTPLEFLIAVQRRFGPISFDLAADESNHVVPDWFGPGSDYATDSFNAEWPARGLLWLNPPYANIEEWARTCAVRYQVTGTIAMLVPASVGTNWFANHVDGKALVLFLRPRLTFVGHGDPYPKDLMLCVYGDVPGYECWKWNT